MTQKTLDVYPDSDFWPDTLEVHPANVIDLSHLIVYRVKGEPVIKLVDLACVDGIIPPEASLRLQAA